MDPAIPPADTPPVSPRRTRRWWKLAAALGAAIAVPILALPWVLSTPSATRWLMEKANAALGPGDLRVDRLRLSWFRPTTLDGVTILDDEGDVILSAPRAVWDRNLFQAIFGRPRLGTLSLEKGTIDVERRPDHRIDLIEFLKPILQGQPGTDLTIRIENATARFRSPELREPILADDFDLLIRRPNAPGPIAWQADLASEGGRTLRIDGEFDRWDGEAPERNGLKLGLNALRWPLAIRSGGVDADVEISKGVVAERTQGFWSVGSTLELQAIQITGDALRGDLVSLDRVEANFGLAQAASGWSIRTLDLRTPHGSLSATGPIPAESGESNRITGRLDLASLVASLPHTLGLKDGLTLDRGLAEISIGAATDGPTRRWTAEASLTDLAGRVGATAVALRQPATFELKATQKADAIAVETLTIRSAFLNAEGRGDLASGVKLAGTLDLTAFARQAGDFVNLERAGLAGNGPIALDLKREADGPFVGNLSLSFETASVGPAGDPVALQGLKFDGSIKAPALDMPRDWTSEVSLDLASARRDGLDLGPTQIKLHYEPGSLLIDPIATSLNGGTLRVVPEFDLKSEPPVFRLKTGTELVSAEVNERATQRVLAFVAPILEGATRASGRVSATIGQAEFPIGSGRLEDAVVEGNVVFDHLMFTPGPLTRELLTLLNRDDTTLEIDQPVVLSISEGKIYQTGFNVPIGDVTAVSIEGTVGFDKVLDLEASMPITPAMFPNGGILGDFIAGTRVTVPIGGTLDKPRIDRDAFRAAMRDTGRDMLLRGATQGAASMLFRLTQPRDPNAPRPLTPAERKAKRLEKKLERRGG